MEPGTISQLSPLLVRLDSSTTGVPALTLTSYGMPVVTPPPALTFTAPVVGDRVAVVRFGSRLLILGKVA